LARRAAAAAGIAIAGAAAPAVWRATILCMTDRARLAAHLPALPAGRPRRWMPTLAAGLSVAQYARSLVRRLAALVAVLLTAIWALGGQGYFWPAWAWLGVGVPVLLDFTAGWAWRKPAGPVRRVACVWALVSVVAVILVLTWLLTFLLAGVTHFWPAWALVGLYTVSSAYSLSALQDRVLVARGRQALKARIDMLTRTRREAVDAQAAELRRIERDLHDGAQARLVALTLQLGRAEVRVDGQPEVQRLIRDAQREAQHAIAELRDLARGIVPPLLADRGLGAAVESLAARYGLGTAVEVDVPRELSPAVERAAYFVVAEALTNTAKHASARRSWVRLSEDDRALNVLVGDDGCGRADVSGSGIVGLRARVEALDGTLDVESPESGGTVVKVRIPCA
jgi:signal transduction histidine kinase